ncbi:MAG: insulinase family protein [Candidatus Eisenbacteria bacterium]|uniref:Insulinase family protein n=1 Tax=Eiseniibacteriota bacterium TaxID=2212470 RepID=A0A938BRQ5_UNCEI|nr:insulinase family protein [Candidatus Eisenbacteria bacterium]
MKTKRSARGRGALALAAALLLTGTCVAAASPATWKHPRDLEYPPLGEIRTPRIEERVLDNGLTLFLLEDHDFPMVDFQMLVRVGSIYEPAHLKGLAGITGTVLRTGGTGSIPGDELDERLESLGALLEASIGSTEGALSGSFLSKDAVTGLELFADLLRHPAFPEEKLELAKIDARTAIAGRNDEPLDIARREFRKLMYGADSPYGWHPEYADIAAITREDLVDFHAAYFHPQRMILSVYGDFDPAAMTAEIERVLGAWPADHRPLPPDPPVPSRGPEGVYYARKDGVTQSTVLFGLIGTVNSDPDYAALQLVNQILGADFSSRLVSEIRTRRGLAYAVGSSPGTGWHHPGVWTAFLMTQSDSTLTATRAMRGEVERITREPVTAEELARAKESVLNSLVFDLSSKREVLRRRALYAYHGYPEDFLERYQQKVRALAADELLAVARARIRPAEIAVVVVGKAEDFDEPLTALGPVTELDIAIPPPPTRLAIPEPTAESLARGQQILEAAAAAHGGAALANLRSVRSFGRGTLSMMGNAMSFAVEELRAPPARTWRKLNIGGMFEILEARDAERGWRRTPQGIDDLSPEEIAAAKEDGLRELEHFLAHRREMVFQALGAMDFEGAACQAVLVRETPVRDWILYFDAADRVAGMEYQGRGPAGGPAATRAVFSDYRSVAGAFLPHGTRVILDGQEFMAGETERIEVNGEVDEGLFARP